MADAEHDRLAAPDRNGAAPDATNQRPLTAAARRALEEAAARRGEHESRNRPAEQGGRGGLEPVRYGDWEVKGLASDF